ncbi:hypothetical protein DSECCO2_524350 [anaerobic digester metagenome]
MPDIPDNFVIGDVKAVHQRQRQLHHAEVGGQMPPGAGDGVHQLGPDFFGKKFQLEN